MIEIRETGEVLPFGYINKDWKSFKSSINEGDDIFRFEVRDGLFYMDGYVQIRAGCVVQFLRGIIT